MTSLKLLPITVAGASGRMGHMLIEAILASDDCHLTGALDMASSPALGQDAGAALGRSTGVTVTSDLHAGLRGSSCLIDFTRPERWRERHPQVAANGGTGHVHWVRHRDH